MKMVAVDTSGLSASVAALEDGALLAERWQSYARQHSSIIMPMLEEMLEKLSWQARDVDVWAAVVGPGSFTGLRIGVSTVRALAHAWNKPCVGVNAIEALAMMALQAPDLIVPVIDARNKQVYTGAYHFSGDSLLCDISPKACGIMELLDELTGRDVTFLAGGAIVHRDLIIRRFGKRARFLPAHLCVERAGAAAVLAAAKVKAGETVTYRELAPLYLKKPQAQRDYERAHPEEK
ncbi:MAG: tRNA (adenosine(37)-N6)-threonylcarbamoyltransferase complex dimerization subunit type 1 TsaB [Christensenellales bacterium]|jgi:tRNA threonylcarbamoyladenosine biosynthesis protein TsaB